MLTEGDAVMKSPLAHPHRVRRGPKKRKRKGMATRSIVPLLKAAGVKRTRPKFGGYFG